MATAMAAAGMATTVAARRGIIAAAGIGGSERGKFLGQFLGAAMRAFGIFPIGGADEDFAVALAFGAMEFVNRHGNKLGRCAEISSWQ